MVQRTFGPVRAAGVQIIEVEGEKTIQPGALGQTAYAGLWEKGDVGKLIQIPSAEALTKKLGSFIDDGFAPDAADDFFDVGGGAGALWAVRVTDGNELVANGHVLEPRTALNPPLRANLFARRKLLTPVGRLEAKNGGRWGGKDDAFSDEFALIGDLTNTTLDTGHAFFTTDQWKGGFVELDAVANKRYPIVGNTAAGVITVASDQTMLDDHTAAAGGTNFRYYLVLENTDDQGNEKALSFRVRDGEEFPDTEFALDIFVDGVLVKTYGNLSTDPTSTRYWVPTINDDDGNDEVTAVDLFTGTHTADVRPANHYGEILTVTATVMTRVLEDFTINSPGGGDPTLALGTTTDDMLEQTITITMTSALAGTAVSDRFGSLGTVTLGSLFDPATGAGGAEKNKWIPPFTVTAGGSPLAATDTLVINYKPFVPKNLIDGFLFPDKVNAKRVKFRITDNDHKSITVASGSDLTVDGAATDEFLVEAPLQLNGGRDGNADVVDADFISQAWDVNASPFRQLVGKNLGLVKFATPGVTSVAVQKAGVAYAEAKNYQYAVEVPSNVVTEAGADDFVNNQVGRNDFAVTFFPSFGKIADPEGGAGLKQVPLVGQKHGREARIAVDFEGYHKAAAGITAILPKVLELTTGDTVLDEEFLNPLGINVIKKIKGNFVVFGDRTLHLDPAFRFKHQREQLTHYEHILQEEFDFSIFEINDPINDALIRAALRGFFLPEFRKRALRGDDFEDAALIKVDAENNTDATRAAGDLFADVLLRLADTVERFRIRIGKQGVFTTTA